MNKFKWFSLIALFCTSLACATLTNTFRPATEIIISPKESTGWDQKYLELEDACQVIRARLQGNLKGRYNVKVIENGQISVSLYDIKDLETAKRLSTETGAIIFVDSVESYPQGYEFGDQGNIIFTQKDMKTATASSDQQNSSYLVAFTMTSDGAKKMGEYSSNNVGHYLVIVKDGIVITSPRIQNPITNGNGVITGKYTLEEATELAAILMNEPLPFPLVVTEVKSP